MATTFRPAPAIRSDDRFFLVTAMLMAATVFAGFSLQLAMGRSSFAAPPLVHLHAVVFMGWVVLYALQTVLAATGGIALHRRLGWIGAAWIAVMVPLGLLMTVNMVRSGTAPFFFQPGYFLVMNGLSVLTFGGLTIAAIILRRRTAWHRRLHYCGMAFLIGPAFGRLLPMPLLMPHAGWAVFAALMLYPAAGILFDLRRSGRVHPAWWWGTATMLAAQLAMSGIAYSPLGDRLYRAATAGSPGAAVPPLNFPPPPGGPLITGR